MNRRKWVRGKNRRAESNIVTAYLQNIEVSYSHLYRKCNRQFMIVKRLHGWILTVISIHITGL